MGFFQTVRRVFSHYRTYSDRTARADFNYFLLFYFLISIPLFIGDRLVASLVPAELYFLWTFQLGPGFWLGWLAMTIPYIALSCRRLHDVGLSGWWQAGPPLLMTAGIIAGLSGGQMITLLISNLSSLSWLALFVWLMIIPGHARANAFGPAPD